MFRVLYAIMESIAIETSLTMLNYDLNDLNFPDLL